MRKKMAVIIGTLGIVGVGSVAVAGQIGSGTLAPLLLHRKIVDKNYDVKIQVKDGPVHVVTNTNDLAPGGIVDWHNHSGVVAVTITGGAMTSIDSETCTATVYPAGTTFIETGEDTHKVINESTTGHLTWVSTSFLPPGAPGRNPQPAPANCPF